MVGRLLSAAAKDNTLITLQFFFNLSFFLSFFLLLFFFFQKIFDWVNVRLFERARRPQMTYGY